MKAVRIHEFGGPEVLAIEDIPMPEPMADEVLVRVHATSVNPVDYKMRSGGYAKGVPEGIHLGRDIAGTIEKTGEDVQDFAIGDRVFAMLPRDRTGHAEFVTLEAALCVPVPKNVDDAEAAAIPLAAITAWQGLFDHGSLQPGQHVLIHGGAGGVGHLAVQMAHAIGAKVSTTVSSQDREFARTLGADQVVDYKNERFEEQVRDVDLVFDLVAGETQERSWNVLRPGGVLVSTLSEPSQQQAKQHQARGMSYIAQPNGRELEEISRWVEAGKLHPVVASTLPIEEVAKAQSMLEREHVRGKVVLRLN
jgi:NADPH:quinone reductase-like Zn-dependent oxidoreductase